MVGTCGRGEARRGGQGEVASGRRGRGREKGRTSIVLRRCRAATQPLRRRISCGSKSVSDGAQGGGPRERETGRTHLERHIVPSLPRQQRLLLALLPPPPPAPAPARRPALGVAPLEPVRRVLELVRDAAPAPEQPVEHVGEKVPERHKVVDGPAGGAARVSCERDGRRQGQGGEEGGRETATHRGGGFLAGSSSCPCPGAARSTAMASAAVLRRFLAAPSPSPRRSRSVAATAARSTSAAVYGCACACACACG